MNCPKCGNPVASRKRYCEACGTDISVYRKIIRLSNGYYNSGLAKARVRDLSGAIEDLKKSLEYNKKNIDARNLLGLVYYELGETVAALSEWVISKNFRSEDNDAEMYLEKVQDNPNELDNTNQAIKKYNLALQAAKEGNDDTAILQLKKVLNLHPNFMRALQLVSLLLIKTGDYDRARKYLTRALKIDVANTTALRYMAEITHEDDSVGGAEAFTKSGSDSDSSQSGRGIEVMSSYREDKPNAMVFINLLLGVLIGVAVVYYLIVPTIKQNIRDEYESKKVDYSAEVNAKEATIVQQDTKIKSLEKKIDELQSSLENSAVATIEVPVESQSYDSFFDAWNEYRQLKAKDYTDEELQQLALDLWAVDTTGITNESALTILESMREDIYPSAARRIYKSGKTLYDEGDFEASTGMLEAAVAFSPTNDAAMYYLGKSYQALEDFEHAVYYYKLMLEVCPNSTLKEYIPQRLHECGADE